MANGNSIESRMRDLLAIRPGRLGVFCRDFEGFN